MAEEYIVTPLTPMRRAIAVRMAEATRVIPHFRLGMDIELDALMVLRNRMRKSYPGRAVTLNDLLIKACATALMDVPAVNIQWKDSEIHQYKTADISVVISVKGGLATPIVRCAESKCAWQISREIGELRAKASQNSLKMNEILGGSFSVSNLGMHGVDEFDAIINLPQCAILAIGCARPRSIPSCAGEARVARVMRATLSVDHRAIDGTTGAQFLTALRDRVENPQYIWAATT